MALSVTLLAALAGAPPALAGGAAVRRVPLALTPLPGPHAAAAWTTLAPHRIRPRFGLVGLHWRGAAGSSLAVRVRTLRGGWGTWRELGETVLTRSPGATSDRHISEPLWVGSADVLQVRLRGAVTRLWAVVVAPGSDPTLRRPHSAAAHAPTGGVVEPPIIPRADWGADEALRRKAPAYAPRATVVFLHHTETPNGYRTGQAKAIVRSIYLYQVSGNGWDDLGYNFLVDAAGRIYEGRYGGVGRNVIGAHTSGFNQGSIGIALIGSFRQARPSAAQLRAVEALIAWRLDVAHADPTASVTLRSAGNERFKAGRRVQFAAISAHRDASATDCPGDALYRLLPEIRAAVAAVGPTHVWAPALSPALIVPAAGGIVPIRFTATLSRATTWRVTVRTTAGVVVATMTGSGTAVAATWSGGVAGGGALPPARDLRWEIAAGAGRSAALSATGPFDGSGAPTGPDGGGQGATAAAADLVVTPTVIRADSGPATLSWRAVVAGQVRITVTTPTGEEVAVLQDTVAVAAGTQTVSWDGLRSSGGPAASGQYRFRVQIQPDGGVAAETATAAVGVRRQVTALSSTERFSPNGDGSADTATIAYVRNEGGGATLRLLDGKVVVANVATLYDQAIGPFSYVWGGGGVPDGRYQLQLLAPGAGGVLDLRVPLTIDTHAPTLALTRASRASTGTLRALVAVSEPATLELRVGRVVVGTVTVAKAGSVMLRVPRGTIARGGTLLVVAVDGVGNRLRHALRVHAT